MIGITEIVLSEVAAEYKVSERDVRGRSRLPYCIPPRFTAVRLLRDYGASSVEIGKILGGRDHTTILNALSRFADMAEDEGFRGRYEAIRTRVDVARGAFFSRKNLRPVFKSVRATA